MQTRADLIARTRECLEQQEGRAVTDEEVQGLVADLRALAKLVIDVYVGQERSSGHSPEETSASPDSDPERRA